MNPEDSALARLVRAVGTDAFGARLLAMLDGEICTTDQIVGFARSPGQPGIQLFSVGCLPPRLAHALTRRYLDSYHRMDPSASDPDTAPPADVWLSRMNPSMPASSVYKDFFFYRGRLADRIAFTTVWHATLLSCHLYRSSRSPCFSDDDVQALERWMGTIAAVLRQHYVVASAMPRVAAPESLDERAAAVASLSRREQDVFRRLLAGLSTDAIALDLGVSANTVRTFRKKLYRKLEVSSRFDLYDKYVHHRQAGEPPDPAPAPPH